MVKVRERHSNRPAPVTFELSDGRCTTSKKLFTSHSSVRPIGPFPYMNDMEGWKPYFGPIGWRYMIYMTPPCQRKVDVPFPKDMSASCSCPRSEGIYRREWRA